MSANDPLADMPIELVLAAREFAEQLSTLPSGVRYVRGVALFEILAAKFADGRAPGNLLDPQPMALCFVVAAITYSFALSHGAEPHGGAAGRV